MEHSALLIVLSALIIGHRTITTTDAAKALHGCRRRCGSLTVPYPFGIGDGCFLEKKFNITCYNSRAYLGVGNLRVTNISLNSGEMRVLQPVASDCYERGGAQDPTDNPYVSLWIADGDDFTMSATKNKFTAIGCDTVAIIDAYAGERRYTTGCLTLCDRKEDIDFGSCTGVGCCQITSIPSRLDNISISLSSYYNHTYVWDFNPCSYAILAEETQFRFTNSSFEDFKKIKEFPLVLDWAVGYVSCEEAKRTKSLKCKGNSKCVDSNATGIGYRCQCQSGFEGNPYLQDCRDIDECMTSNPCMINAACINTPGSYNCPCEMGYSPINNGTECTKISSANNGDRSNPRFLYIPLCVSIGFTALVVASFMILWAIRKRKLIKLKEKFFEQNGGLILQQRLSGHRPSMDTTRIYTLEELKTATKNFNESRILGEGGYGTVYKGILRDNKVIAIKKSKIGIQTQNEQFINEVIVLMQINHKNVVKLFGCCLETEVPILVYEFINNRTLFDHIHNKRELELQTLSWELRLKIAAETADALAYLHYQTSTPIVHRDVKTANILLDNSYTAKVSDFGTSRLIPLDQEYQLQTFVQGTLGYLDPEYMRTSQLTEKSDVYSFGVVLAELLTSRKVLALYKQESERNLANCFVCAVNENRLGDILDAEIVNDDNVGDVEDVVRLARRCLMVKGEERPTMRQVAVELAELARAPKHPREEGGLNSEETGHLLGSVNTRSTFDIVGGDQSTSTTRACYSMQNEMLYSYGDGR